MWDIKQLTFPGILLLCKSKITDIFLKTKVRFTFQIPSTSSLPEISACFHPSENFNNIFIILAVSLSSAYKKTLDRELSSLEHAILRDNISYNTEISIIHHQPHDVYLIINNLKRSLQILFHDVNIRLSCVISGMLEVPGGEFWYLSVWMIFYWAPLSRYSISRNENIAP